MCVLANVKIRHHLEVTSFLYSRVCHGFGLQEVYHLPSFWESPLFQAFGPYQFLIIVYLFFQLGRNLLFKILSDFYISLAAFAF